MRWDEVNARARGLATHLLPPESVGALAAARDWPEFIARVVSAGYPIEGANGGALDAADLDRAVGLVTARRFDLLGRWMGKRRGALGVILELEERATLRALLRGAAQGASPGARLRAVLPTPGLPSRLLERLARAETVTALVQGLLRAGHPAGRALDVAVGQGAPGLRALDWVLARLFLERARRAAQPGGPLLRRFVADLTDEENAWTLLLAAPADSTGEFLPGGARITECEFERLHAERDRERRLESLRHLLRGTVLGDAMAKTPVDLPSLPARIEAARAGALRAAARRDPLGPAPVLEVLLRIRAEARAIRGIAWGVSLGAPPAVLQPLIPEAA